MVARQRSKSGAVTSGGSTLAVVFLFAMLAFATSRGDLEPEFEINSKDEIGYLSETFKKMQLSLRIAMKRLTG